MIVLIGFICLVVGLIVGFIAGVLVYRNNAKKFKELEVLAKAKGKSIQDLLR